jgi:hypothetical protein
MKINTKKIPIKILLIIVNHRFTGRNKEYKYTPKEKTKNIFQCDEVGLKDVIGIEGVFFLIFFDFKRKKANKGMVATTINIFEKKDSKIVLYIKKSIKNFITKIESKSIPKRESLAK